MRERLKRDHRLSWAFMICKNLGIDDPVLWMDTVDPVILDRWIAFEQNEQDQGVDNSPEAALEKLSKL
jgi:hypothetical protein